LLTSRLAASDDETISRIPDTIGSELDSDGFLDDGDTSDAEPLNPKVRVSKCSDAKHTPAKRAKSPIIKLEPDVSHEPKVKTLIASASKKIGSASKSAKAFAPRPASNRLKTFIIRDKHTAQDSSEKRKSIQTDAGNDDGSLSPQQPKKWQTIALAAAKPLSPPRRLLG
jgi:hypothetical protein